VQSQCSELNCVYSVVVGNMDSPIIVSDCSEPDWNLVAHNSKIEWVPSTICAMLYLIFISPEDEDSEDDEVIGGL